MSVVLYMPSLVTVVRVDILTPHAQKKYAVDRGGELSTWRVLGRMVHSYQNTKLQLPYFRLRNGRPIVEYDVFHRFGMDAFRQFGRASFWHSSAKGRSEAGRRETRNFLASLTVELPHINPTTTLPSRT
jgi:hypothetical protein